MSKILQKLYEKLRSLAICESAQDTVEYAMLVTLIALVCISGAQSAANSVNQLYGQVSQAFDTQQQGQQQQPPQQNHHHDHGGGHGGGQGGGHFWGWH